MLHKHFGHNAADKLMLAGHNFVVHILLLLEQAAETSEALFNE